MQLRLIQVGTIATVERDIFSAYALFVVKSSSAVPGAFPPGLEKPQKPVVY
jgi:hypothetical protein